MPCLKIPPFPPLEKGGKIKRPRCAEEKRPLLKEGNRRLAFQQGKSDGFFWEERIARTGFRGDRNTPKTGEALLRFGPNAPLPPFLMGGGGDF